MSAMAPKAALEALRKARSSDDVVITTMGAARDWMAMGPTAPLDFVYVPSSMSQATSVGLGLALARPDRRIVVANGDGSMLMNLGSLVTIAALRPANLIVIVCVNGVYEVTGAQPVPGAGVVDYAGLARSAGFRSVHRFDDLARWTDAVPGLMAAPGPTFIELAVTGAPGVGGPKSPGPAGERARKFMAALAGG